MLFRTLFPYWLMGGSRGGGGGGGNKNLNDADPAEVQHSVAFHQGILCLPASHFRTLDINGLLQDWVHRLTNNTFL